MEVVRTEVIEVVDTYCDVCGKRCPNGQLRTVVTHSGVKLHSCGSWWPQKRTSCDVILFSQILAGTFLGKI